MGLYSEQIAARIKNDTDSMEKAYVGLASAVMGRIKDSGNAQDSINEILSYYHVQPMEVPGDITETDEILEFLLRPAGIMRRNVNLTGNWHKDGIGPLLARLKDGVTVALIPGKVKGYTYFDYSTGKRVGINRKNAGNIQQNAYCFYNPLPAKKLKISDLFIFMARSLAVSDYISVAAVTLAVTLLGMLLPYANTLLFGSVIASGKTLQLMAVASLLLGATVSASLINITKSLLMAKINTKIEIAVESASMSRMLSLPASFFKDYSSGEVTERFQSLTSLCGTLVDIILETGLSSVFSLIYIAQISVLAPTLAVPALIFTAANIIIAVASALVSIRTSKKIMEGKGKLSGLVYSLFTGVQKIKLAGAERRAFAKWAKLYRPIAALSYSPPWFVRIGSVVARAVSLTGTVVLFWVAGASGISAADYMAFNISYGMVSGAIMSLAGIAVTVSGVKPVADMAKPLLQTEPEVSPGKRVVTKLTGYVEINNISFRYGDDLPLVIDNLSLRIRKGQYIGIVGASGCGKSTLMRLLLGFEQPGMGAIYYDRHDMRTADLKSLRKNIGCVIQHGKLMSGSILQNITLSAPWLTVEQAWEAAEMAGIADDIRDMPMGMHTMIGEGSGGISGGQRQRLLIARAIAPKPKILLLDEATSALDNITQKHISESLDSLKCTRIVIAHRLTTIRRCDRIVMLDGGRIAEDGTYDELIALGGKFAELVARQRLDG